MSNTRVYVHVAPCLPIPAHQSQVYTYYVDASLVPKDIRGVPVTISFRTVSVAGIIVGTAPEPKGYIAKRATIISGYRLSSAQLQFAQWIATTLQGGLGYTLRLMLPGVLPSKTSRHLRVKKIETRPSAGVRKIIRELKKKPIALMGANKSKRQQLLKQLSEHYVAQGQQVLIVVAEKWQADAWQQGGKKSQSTPAILHSGVSASERRRIWHGVAGSSTAIVVGTQKAIWLPFQKLGLVILDQEELPSHKLWDQYPLMPNWHLVRKLAEIHAAKLIITSVTPSLRLQYAIDQNSIKAIAEESEPPTPHIISHAWSSNDKLLFPKHFISELRRWRKSGKSVLILYNRRGAFSVTICRACNNVLRCPNCATALTWHNNQKLICHYCAFTMNLPARCPACNKRQLTMFGKGTEYISQLLGKLIPSGETIIRIDGDTAPLLTPRARAHIRTGKNPAIIIGTQAVFTVVHNRQFDYVVFLFPEQALLYPDFRSEERAYSTLARLQQMTPPSQPVTIVTRSERLVRDRLIFSSSQMYNQQMKERRRLGYPPLHDAVLLTLVAGRSTTAYARASQVQQKIALRHPGSAVTIRGPFQSFRQKRRGKYEYHLLLLGPLDQLVPLYSGVPSLRVDLDPQRIL